MVVNSLPAPPAISVAGTPPSCTGTSTNLSVPSIASYTYQWKRNKDFISGQTTNVLPSTVTGEYMAIITDGNGCSSESEIKTITFVPSPVNPTINVSKATSFCQGDSINLNITPTVGLSYQWKLNGGAIGNNLPAFYAASTGVYTIDVTNTYGCTKSSSNNIVVTVYNLPPKPTINLSGPTKFCQGGSVTLSVTNNANYTYQWSNNGPTTNSYTVTNAGIYALTLSNSFGCYSKSDNVSITVLSLPPVLEITANGTIEFCKGGNVTLAVPSRTEYTYEWFKNNKSQIVYTSTILAEDSGLYSVKVSNSDKCTSESSNKINVKVNTPPIISSVTYSKEPRICLGDSVKLEVVYNSNYQYIWKLDNKQLNETAYFIWAKNKGNYSVDVSYKGCAASSPTQNIEFKSSYGKPTLYVKGPVVWYFGCSNTKAKEYEWYKKGSVNPIPNAKSYIYVANKETGYYQVRINDGGECWVASDFVGTSIQAQQTNAMPADYDMKLVTLNVEPSNEMVVFPNPAKGKFTIKLLNDYCGEMMISVKDLTGRVIKEEKDVKTLDLYEKEIILTENVKGFYFVDVVIGTKRQLIKVVME